VRVVSVPVSVRVRSGCVCRVTRSFGLRKLSSKTIQNTRPKSYGSDGRLAEHRLPGLVVTDATACPTAILPALQVVWILVPTYV
jgi:hypothetical protein